MDNPSLRSGINSAKRKRSNLIVLYQLMRDLSLPAGGKESNTH
jgi:hypothetical protein